MNGTVRQEIFSKRCVHDKLEGFQGGLGVVLGAWGSFQDGLIHVA